MGREKDREWRGVSHQSSAVRNVKLSRTVKNQRSSACRTGRQKTLEEPYAVRGAPPIFIGIKLVLRLSAAAGKQDKGETIKHQSAYLGGRASTLSPWKGQDATFGFEQTSTAVTWSPSKP